MTFRRVQSRLTVSVKTRLPARLAPLFHCGRFDSRLKAFGKARAFG